MKLNIGCGSQIHPDWINADLSPAAPGIVPVDIRKGLPFEAASFDAVYHSHVLEHLTRAAGKAFIIECRRVLKPGGVLRIAVPDLERIARLYLELDHAAAGDASWDAKYEWMLLELYDQTVRESSGGEMAVYLVQEMIPCGDFIVERIGTEGRSKIDAGESKKSSLAANMINWRRFVRLKNWRDFFIRKILGTEYEKLQLGRFRRRGEIHPHMYDRWSLQKLLTEAGLTDITLCTPIKSRIPNWNAFHLDAGPNGAVYKPDSIFEAFKPS